MGYIFVTFRSRTTSSQAYNFLQSKGINCSLFSTPKQVAVGCGVSVRFAENDFSSVLGQLGRNHPNFVGYFRVSDSSKGRVVTPI
ncbi:MAG: DUF3343 domain-containing protein [Clostridia bacterium]